MATIIFARQSNGKVKFTSASGRVRNLGGDWDLETSGTRILISSPGRKTIEVETSGNTIQDASGTISGTVDEIREGLAASTFFKSSGGGGAVDLFIDDTYLNGDGSEASPLAVDAAALPVSTAQQTALNGKSNTGHTHTASNITDFNTAALAAAPAETATTIGSLINSLTAKTTPVDADYIGVMDSAASNVWKKLSWSNIKATLKTYFDTVYAAVSHTHAQSDVTNLVSDLAAKQTQIDASYGRIAVYAALGSSIKSETVTAYIKEITTTFALTDGLLYFVAMEPLKQDATITGVKFLQTTQGNYTADNENTIGLYTYSGGTLTRVAISANTGNIWKGTGNTVQSVAFSSTYAATANTLYFVGILYNNSAQTTAPVIGAKSGMSNTSILGADFTNSAKLSASLGGANNTLPSTQAMSALALNGNFPWFALY